MIRPPPTSPLFPYTTLSRSCIGVAPANGEARSSIVPAEFGGNMDAPEVSVGNTLYLPVNVHVAAEFRGHDRSEEHTSELQSHLNLVCRLLLEKKKKTLRIYWHLNIVSRPMLTPTEESR